jgi:CelD/BcsL family acetyltransferase involved in cellulose biosynthesis
MSAGIATADLAPAEGRARISVAVCERIEELADAWSALERENAVLASQKLGLVRAWIESHALEPRDCIFISISMAGEPVFVLPLRRFRAFGVRVATWFTGEHLGSYAPLVDMARWSVVAPAERKKLWRQALALIPACDLVHMPDVPAPLAEALGMVAALGGAAQADSVHVARYADWASCDFERRDKHRRKVDRQQGNKLAARGVVRFESVEAGEAADEIIETMFCQRAERFRVQGIRDPFRSEAIKAFYKRAMREADGVLHVLRLDGEVIGVRYNLRAGGGLFSLVTSMHPSPELQSGSPGKQNLHYVMQTVFDAGCDFVDMGKGESEEKRLWCNEAVPLMTFTRALSPAGRLAAAGLAVGERAKGSIKRRPELFEMYRKLRSRVGNWGARS